jgi:hypothetical protein
MALTIQRVNALPETLAAETIYLVKTGNELTLTVTGNTGAVVATTVSKADVNTAISTAIGALGMSNSVEFAADIAARDAMTPTKSTFVYVADATADETVSAGAAMYLYDFTNTTWHKVTEYESLDLVLSWDNIDGKPESSAEAIDSAVSKRHSHDNMDVLDLLTAPDGKLQYNGEDVGGVISNGNEW